MTLSTQKNWRNYTVIIFSLSLAFALSGTALVSVIILNLPSQDVQQLIYILTGTGVMTTLTSYGLYRIGIIQWLKSLRWALLLIIAFTIILILTNVWILARLMFIDTYYLSMTATMLVFAGLTAMTFSFFVSKTMTDRLSELMSAAESLAKGQLNTRIEVKGNDEIASLTMSFNAMARSLEDIDEQKKMLEKTRRDLVAWVSHDLRTPLTSIRVMLEAMSDGVVSDEATTQRYMKSSLAEIAHLSRLIDDLFEMAQLDVGHIRMMYQQTSLQDMISDTLGSMTHKAQRKQIELSGSIDPEVDIIEMAPDKIQRVLYNLINNAIVYAPAGAKIHISTHDEGDDVRVCVFNSGTSIPEDLIPQLFLSFYRGEESRAQSEHGERGTGLGLAIARGFIEAHHGRIWAESRPETGTRFYFVIPKKQQENL